MAIEDRDQLHGRATRFDQAALVLVERIRSDPEQGPGPALGQAELGSHLADRLGRRDAVLLLLQATAKCSIRPLPQEQYRLSATQSRRVTEPILRYVSRRCQDGELRIGSAEGAIHDGSAA